MSRYGVGLRTGLATVIAALFLAAPASAAVFTVDVVTDPAVDALPNNGCEAAGGDECTFREALEKANDEANLDQVGFLGALDSQTINITTDMPAIADDVFIDGCSSFGPVTEPCIGVNHAAAAGGNEVLTVSSGVSSVTIKGLAIGQAGTAVNVLSGAAGVALRNNWIGLNVAGNPSANLLGLLITDADNGVIGDNVAAGRNVFASNGAHLRIDGGDNISIQGNWFGLDNDGVTTRPATTESIEIVGTAANSATGNSIGAPVDGAAQNTAVCDGACNVIGGTTAVGTGVGIDLQGDGGLETPADGVTVEGNMIGFSVNGTTPLNNDSRALYVGEADNVTVGGSTEASRNFFGNAGGNLFLQDDPGNQPAVDLRLERNSFGVGSDGTTLATSGQVSINSQPPSPADGVVVHNNLFAGNGLTDQGLQLFSRYATVTGNTFGLGSSANFDVAAISVLGGETNTIGGTNPGEGNVIGLGAAAPNGPHGTGAPGIYLYRARNRVVGNLIGTNGTQANLGNGGAGILVCENGANIDDGNVIGGSTAASENVISNNAAAAIAVVEDPGCNNTGAGTENRLMFIGRNRGSGNGGLFIDLGGDGFGNTANPQNDGIANPVITSTTASSASGTSAPGATILLFETPAAAGSNPSAITRFLGTTTASGGGAWSLGHDAPSSRVTALQADDTLADCESMVLLTFCNSSELAPAVGTPAAAAGGGVVTPPATPAPSAPVKKKKKKCKKKRKTGASAAAKKCKRKK